MECAARTGSGGKLEDMVDNRTFFQDMLENRKLAVGTRNRPLLAKPLTTPLPYDRKMYLDEYQIQFEPIAELNGWNTSTMAIYLVLSLSGCTQAVLTDLDTNSRTNYQVLREMLSLQFGTVERWKCLDHN